MSMKRILDQALSKPEKKLSRFDRNWRPDEGDERSYVYRRGYWECLEEAPWTDEDEAALEEHEERKRERIARENEY